MIDDSFIQYLSQCMQSNHAPGIMAAYREVLDGSRPIEDKRDVTFRDKYHCDITINSSNFITVSDLIPDDDHDAKIYNSNDVTKLEINIHAKKVKKNSFYKVKCSIASKINKVLSSVSCVNELSLEFFGPEFVYNHIQDIIMEIKNDYISMLSINFKKNDSPSIFKPEKPLITNEKFLHGFKNLKCFQIEKHMFGYTMYDVTSIDILSKIKGLSLHLNGFSNFYPSSPDTSEKVSLNGVLSKIIKNKIYFSLSTGKFESEPRFMSWLEDSDVSSLSLITSIEIMNFTVMNLHKLTKFLPYMINLQSLKIGIVEVGPTFNMENRNLSYIYKSFKNLKQLKTIVISLAYSEDGCDLFSRIFKEIGGTINNGADQDMYQKDIIPFLSMAPECLENLYLNGKFNITNEITSKLNKSFPNLSFLFFGSLRNAETKSIEVFENLEMFVNLSPFTFELPKNIQLCMVGADSRTSNTEDFPDFLHNLSKASYSDVDSNIPKIFARYKKCFEHYRGLKCLKREYDLYGSVKGKIFFNSCYYLLKFKECIGEICNLDKLSNLEMSI
uniref:F-box domain-containing protein n=1 Tax=Strongyloides papillosus TaxID=174720 RepID=A0A0N5CAD3_STREA